MMHQACATHNISGNVTLIVTHNQYNNYQSRKPSRFLESRLNGDDASASGQQFDKFRAIVRNRLSRIVFPLSTLEFLPSEKQNIQLGSR